MLRVCHAPQHGVITMRKFIRHPSDIPIEYTLRAVRLAKIRLKNVSVGGLSFTTRERLNIGREIELTIPGVRPVFRARARVAWCLPRKGCFDIGVQFVDQDDAYRARMVEQVCYIEQYKNDVKRAEGRNLSGEEAAFEWIRKYASTFPGLAGKSK